MLSALTDPGGPMPIALHHEEDNTYRLEFSGRLESADYSRVEGELSAIVGEAGTVKLLCLLDEFEGFGRNVGSGLSFYATHGDQITRIAIVGTERWRQQAMMFAVAGLRKAPVQFFLDTDLAKAREWLAA